MRIVIKVDGETYCTPTNDKVDAQATANQIYDGINEFDKLQFNLAEGGYIVMGAEAVKRAVIIIQE